MERLDADLQHEADALKPEELMCQLAEKRWSPRTQILKLLELERQLTLQLELERRQRLRLEFERWQRPQLERMLRPLLEEGRQQLEEERQQVLEGMRQIEGQVGTALAVAMIDSLTAENLQLCPRCNSTKTESRCPKDCPLGPGLVGKPFHYRCLSCGIAFSLAMPILRGSSSSPNDDNGDTTDITMTLQAYGSIQDQLVRSKEAHPGIPAHGGHTSSSSRVQLANSTQDMRIDIESSPNVERDGTATMDPIDAYTSSSSRVQPPSINEANSAQDVRIGIGNSPNVERDDTGTSGPIWQPRLTTDQLVGLAESVLGISASACYTSSTNFPKAANGAAFIASLTAFSLPRTGRATRWLAKFGAIACAVGILAVIGKDLPIEYAWVAYAAFLIPVMAVLSA